MSMFVFLNRSLYIFLNRSISIDAILIISLFLLGSIWFTIYYCLDRFLYMYKMFQLTEQNMFVQVTYKNPMFCKYVLHKQHGQFFTAHSRISLLNTVGDTICLYPSVKGPILLFPNNI